MKTNCLRRETARILCGLLFLVVFALGSVSAHATALTSGTKTSGSVTAGGTQTYTFSGVAGQGVLLFGYSSDYTVKIKVYKPDTSLWRDDVLRLTQTLPDTGTYTVEIYASSGSASGAFDFWYLRGDDSVSGGALTSGQVESGSLDVNAIDSFTFTGTAGEGYMLHGEASSYTVTIRVFKPDGSFMTSSNNRSVGNLPDTGTYTVAVYGSAASASGSYKLYYLRGADSVSGGSLTSGLSKSGSLDVNAIDSFTFTGTTGEGILLYAHASSYTASIRIYEPDGSVLTANNLRSIETLPATGTYTVAVYGSTSSVSGSYNLYYLRGADSVSQGTLITTSERSGNLPLNGLDSYKFMGGSGNSLSVSTTGSYARAMRLYEPDGSYEISGINSLSRTLPATGEYTLALYGSATSYSGPYTVTLTTDPVSTGSSDPAKSGCDAVNPCQPGAEPSEFVGNPINFDLGYKKQVERDYNGGLLSLTRIYRSDSTWTDNTFGERWRHNYARTLDVTGSTAEITDGTGATISFTSSGNWAPDDSDITATFETITGGYAYTLPQNTREIYDSNERLTRIEYIGGGAVDLAYDGGGLLDTVTDENDRTLDFGYTTGRVTSVVTPDGTFSYTYDVDGNLTEVENPDATTREYHYEDTNFDHALTGITDEKGVRYATWEYDAQGRATLSKLAGNVNDFGVTYNADESVTTTNPLGKDTTYYFTKINDLRRVVQADRAAVTYSSASSRYYNYYDNGWLMSETDWEGNITVYDRDDRGLVTQVTEASGTDEARVTTITWDSTFNLPDVVTVGDRQTDYDYDAYGRVSSVTVTDLGTSEARTTSYTYYSNTTDPNGNTVLGRVDTITYSGGAVTKYTYNGDLLVDSVTNAHGQAYAQETGITYDSAGRYSTITNPNGGITALTYSSAGRLETSTGAYGTGLAATTTFTYDDNGNITGLELPNGAAVTYTYDNAQRLTGITDDLGNTITYTLDDAGNITQEDYATATPTLKYTHDMAYDELSRLRESIGAATQTSSYAYDKNSNLTAYTDAKAGETAFAYDGLLRFVSSTGALSNTTLFAWNDLDDPDSVTDARNNATEYVTNAFGEVTEEVSPDRGTLTYEYSSAGNFATRYDARGKETDYTYDDLNRVLTVSYPTDSGNDVSLTYDNCTNGEGRLCSVTDTSGTIDYDYDLLGRVTDVAETRGLLSFTTAYSYDLAGNILTITLPSGRVITYTRNANGQVSGVSADVDSTPTTLASSITYLPFGPMDGLTYGNSLTFSATFDQDYNPTNRTVSGGIFNHSYDTDDNGNIIQIGVVDYAYDALNRLEQEDPGTATDYTYDATHNRLTKDDGTVVTTTVPSGSNKISAVGSDSYTYDASGNITDDDVYEYFWDDEGRLEEIELSGTATDVGSYSYNYLNQRATKTVSSVTTHYVYGAGGLLYGEYDSSGDFIREYVYLNGEPLAQINAGSPETVTYLHTDNLGTPKFGTNSGGSQVWAWAPDAFGVGTPTGSVTVNLRMPGQYFDAESGIFYNWNRYYNPAIGRYISSDPIGLAGGINTFLYAEANPLLYSDPEGLMVRIDDMYCTGQGGGDILPCMPLGGAQGGGGKPGTAAAPAVVGGGIGAGIGGFFDWCQQKFGQIFNSESAEVDMYGNKVSSKANISPPGNCSPHEHQQLQQEVNLRCKSGSRSCNANMSQAEIRKNLAANRQCAQARDRINQACFYGGNANHKNQAHQAWRAYANCQMLLH